MYNEKEIASIKGLYAENDYLLLLIRKLFFGKELTQEEKKIITDTFKNEVDVEILRRKVYAHKDAETPITYVSDFWLGIEAQIFGASRDTITQAVESKARVEKMFETAFNLLKNPDGEKVKLDYDPTSLMYDPLQTGLIARNLYIKAISMALNSIKIIAGKKSETPEQAKKRLEQDSAK